MKDKEKLLSFDEKTSFIFSHSALKEGWDNPNVFQICTLNETRSSMRKRQEIGRGMRLCVDQNGDRIYDPKINVLTVIANESYKDFVGSLQSAEAMKILVGAEEINQDLIIVDVWKGTFRHLKNSPRQDCLACQGKYEFLEGQFGMKTTLLCGQNAVQVLNPEAKQISLAELATHLKSVGEVSYNEFMLCLKVDNHEMVIFPDGRAIVRNTADESLAKGLYAKYVGT